MDADGQRRQLGVWQMERGQKAQYLRVSCGRGWKPQCPGACAGACMRCEGTGARCTSAAGQPSSLRHRPPPPLRLQALAQRIQAGRLSLGMVERIVHARVPIIKFRASMGEGGKRRTTCAVSQYLTATLPE